MDARHLIRLLIMALCVTSVAGCGVSINKEKGLQSKSGAKLDLKWPAGYRYDPATRKLTRPSSSVRQSAPIYITDVTLTVTGLDMDPMIVNVPLDTLTVDLDITSGERTFDVLVNTDFGTTFTGFETAVISPYDSPVVEIFLDVNGSPTITLISISNPAPAPGETITVTGYADDPDPDDILTYTWYTYGFTVPITAFDPSFSGTITPEGGIIGLTLVVEDGYGGVAIANETIYAQGTPPVIQTMSVTPSVPNVGDVISLYGLAADIDTGDQQFYEWTIWDPNGGVTTIPGQDATFTIKTSGLYDVTLTVHDLQGNYVSSSVRIDVTCAFPTPQAPTIMSVVPGTAASGIITITYQYPGGAAAESADGISVFNLYWDESSAVSGTPLITNGNTGGYSATGSITFNCTVGSFYSFQVSAGNSCSVEGPLSASLPVSPTWAQCW